MTFALRGSPRPIIRPFAALGDTSSLRLPLMATSFGLLNTLSDEQLALMLQQEEFDAFQNHALLVPQFTVPATPKLLDSSSSTSKRQDVIVLDDSASDEEPKAVVKAKPKAHEEDEIGVLDVHELFVKYNKLYFHGLLGAVTVEWSAKMTLCAGLCSWRPNGDCRIKLSSKLLQFRSNKELKETLLVRNIHTLNFTIHSRLKPDICCLLESTSASTPSCL